MHTLDSIDPNLLPLEEESREPRPVSSLGCDLPECLLIFSVFRLANIDLEVRNALGVQLFLGFSAPSAPLKCEDYQGVVPNHGLDIDEVGGVRDGTGDEGAGQGLEGEGLGSEGLEGLEVWGGEESGTGGICSRSDRFREFLGTH